MDFLLEPRYAAYLGGFISLGATMLYLGEMQVRRNADRIVYNAIQKRDSRLREENIARYGHGFSDDPRLGLYSI